MAQQDLQLAKDALLKSQSSLGSAKQNVANKGNQLTAAKKQLEKVKNILTSDQNIADGSNVKKATTQLNKVQADQQKAQESLTFAKKQLSNAQEKLGWIIE